MSAASDDRELEEALANAVQLRQRYRTVSQDEPPSAVDGLIRAAARDQVASHRPFGAPTSWRVPLSIAAVVVVSATVSVLVAERHGQLPPDAGDSLKPPPAASELEERTQHGAPQRQLPAVPMRKPDSKALLAPGRPQRAEPNELAKAPQAGGDAFPGSPEPKLSQERSKTQEPAGPDIDRRAPGSAAMQQAAPSAPASPPMGSVQPGTLRDQAQKDQQAQETRDRAAPDGGVAALRKEPAPQAVAPAAAKLERDRVAAEKNSASVPQAWEGDPEAWLKHIDELRLAGQGTDAEASFRAFRDRYPDYPLPAGFVVPER